MRDAMNRLPRRWALVLGAAGLFLAGLLIGGLSSGVLGAFAATGQQSHAAAKAAATKPPFDPRDAARYCQIYEQKVIEETGLSAATLEKANADGLQAVLDQMEKDGKITGAQKAQLQQALAQLRSQPCQNLANLKAGTPTTAQKQALTDARASIVAAVAGALKLPVATLEADLKAGQTVTSLAKAQGVALDTVKGAYLDAAKAQLAKAVSGGTITQGQSDLAYGALQNAVAAGHFPLLEQGSSPGA